MVAGVEPPKQQGQGEVSQSQPRDGNKPLSLPWTLWSQLRKPHSWEALSLTLTSQLSQDYYYRLVLSPGQEALPLSHTLGPPHLLKTPELKTL